MSRRNNSRRRRSYAPRQRELRRRQVVSKAEYGDFEAGWQAHYGEARPSIQDGRQGAEG